MGIKQILINISGTPIDVTNEFANNEFRMQRRADEAFASGNAKLYTDKLSINIPPYSIMEIVYDNGTSRKLLCSSTCTKYLTTKKYNHDVSLLELTAILEGLIVGSKNFSSQSYFKYDLKKIKALLDLMEIKYGYHFVIDESAVLTDDNEYTYGPGSTLFEVLNDIATRYDCRVKVTDIINNEIHLKITKIDNNKVYTIDENRLLNAIYNQDFNNYCKYLETEASNVIDRSFINKVFVSFRAEEYFANADNAKLVLPTRAERIVALRGWIGGFFMNSTTDCRFEISLDKLEEMGIPEGSTLTYTYTFSEWVERAPFLKRIYTDWLWRFDKTTVYNASFSATRGENFIIFIIQDEIVGPAWAEYKCLTDSQWNALKNIEKPLYSYYQSGSNEILGVNNYYGDDLWHNIIGLSTGPFTKNIDRDKMDFYSAKDPNWNDPVFLDVRVYYGSRGITEKVTNTLFQVEYISIVDPMIVNSKPSKAINEAEYKPIARSYDKAANFIDFDIMMQNIGKSNAMLGDVELSIEYDIEGISQPELGDSIVYDSNKWYIINMEEIFNLQRGTITLNCCRTYSKIAEAIGIKTQFKEAKLPMSGIIDRPIYIKDQNDGLNLTIDKESVLIRASFYDFRNRLIGIRYTMPIFLDYSNNKALAYVETDNHFRFKYKLIAGEKKDYQLVDRIYVDNNNECNYVVFNLCSLKKKLTFEQSIALPDFNESDVTIIKTWPNTVLFKDKRERLTFTLELNNIQFIDDRG